MHYGGCIMIKRFFKAIILGLVNCKELKDLLKPCVLFSWLPVIILITCEFLEINMTTDEFMAVIICSAFGGEFISEFILHCLNAMKYQEEHDCDYKTAWKATELGYYDNLF